MQDRDDLLDSLGLVLERYLLRVLERDELNDDSGRTVRQQTASDVLQGDGQSGHELAQHHVHVSDQYLRRVERGPGN